MIPILEQNQKHARSRIFRMKILALAESSKSTTHSILFYMPNMPILSLMPLRGLPWLSCSPLYVGPKSHANREQIGIIPRIKFQQHILVHLSFEQKIIDVKVSSGTFIIAIDICFMEAEIKIKSSFPLSTDVKTLSTIYEEDAMKRNRLVKCC